MNHLDVIVKDGTVRIPSIFMFEDWIDVDPFLTHARKMNCTVVFENEHITVEPNDYESVRRMVSLFVTIISYREIGNAYVRYLGNPNEMSWDRVKGENE
jgi:hypothetical protein